MDSTIADEIAIQHLDDCTSALFLEVPDEQVVLFQSLFESYEGVAAVRTLGVDPPVVCILTTQSMLATTYELLESLRSHIPWKPTTNSRELFAFD